jgi:hypothetical protein
MADLADPGYLHGRYVIDHAPLDTLASELNVGRPRLVQALTAAGIPVRRRGQPRREALTDRALLYRRYVIDGLSVLGLATELHVARATLRSALDQAGIARRRTGRRPAHEILTDREWLRARYVDDRQSISSIARELSLHFETVRRALDRHGISRRTQGGRIAHPNLEDAGWLRRIYLDERRAQGEIAAILEVDKTAVQRAIKRHGVRR